MQLSLDPAQLTAFLIGMARAFGFVFVAQPFAVVAIPRSVRTALAIAIGIAGGGRILHTITVPSDSLALVMMLGSNLVLGILIGYLVNVFMSIGNAAGSSVGLFGGFSPPPSLDPLSLNQSPVTGTFYGMLWLTLFFVSGADTLVVGGLLSSFGPATVFAHPEIGFVIVVKSVSVLMGASLQIAAPILAVLFLTQVIIGILVKVAPQVNAFQFSFPLQLILSFGLMTLSLVLLPNFLQGAVHYILAGEQDILRI